MKVGTYLYLDWELSLLPLIKNYSFLHKSTQSFCLRACGGWLIGFFFLDKDFKILTKEMM